MKSMIFYVSETTAGCFGPYWPVYPEGSDDLRFVRAEIVEADALHALDLANPREGEIVLNSMELP